MSAALRPSPPLEPTRLLAPEDPPPFTVVNAAGKAPILLTCDHASNRVPKSLNGLGLDPYFLGLHIGWDIGAAGVARRLARRFDAPLVLSGYSRLVVDCNRKLDDPALVPEVSDGVEIPGNQGLEEADRCLRAEACFWPYHRRLQAFLDGFDRRGIIPALIAIHSFTPVMKGFSRPWHIGVLWDEDSRISRPLIERLSAVRGLEVGDNQPYSARDPQGYSIETYGSRTGLPHVSIEIRQDLIEQAAGQKHWAGVLAEALGPILAQPGLFTRR